MAKASEKYLHRHSEGVIADEPRCIHVAWCFGDYRRVEPAFDA